MNWTPCLELPEEVAVPERRALDLLGREPLYNTRAVVQQTAVPADTFRAWERRYGLPKPYRTESNQRLYSERDIGVIGWLRDRTGEGMTISRAVQRLRLEHAGLFAPTRVPALDPAPAARDPQLARLRARLLAAIVAFDALAAERVVDEALALLSVEECCARFIQPSLVEIGERWQRGELPVAAEHFATHLIVRRFSTLFDLVAPAVGRGTIVAACPPGEQHEVGLLILAIFLARRDWRVIYLGADVPDSDLVDTVRQVEPDLLCLSATTSETAERALEVARHIRHRMPSPPAVACGGRAFELRHPPHAGSGVHVLSGETRDVADRIGQIVEQRPRANLARSPRG
jgi:methanogenic corrinoid protein MtbC1